MSKRLIQGNTLKLLADNARRITGSNDELCGAEILEIMSRTQGTIKTDGEYLAEIFNSQGNIIKSGNYDNGEICAMPTAPIEENMIFQGWTCSSPLSNNYTIIDSPINAGPIYEHKDHIMILQVNIKEENTMAILSGFYIDYNAVIDWGDGTIEEVTESYGNRHTYNNIGIYYIKINGNIELRYTDTDDDDINGYYNNIMTKYIITDTENILCENDILEKVYFPESITRIPKRFFEGVESLKYVGLNNNIVSFGVYCFRYCKSLEYIFIPYGTTKIRYGTFYNCNKLKSVILPHGLNEICEYSFSGCSSLTGIIIPEGVTSIGDYAFYYCTSLASIQIPEGVTSIGDYAFYLHSGDTSISDYNVLKTLIFPSTLTNIGNELFGDRKVDNFVLLANEVCTVNGTLFQIGMSESYINRININIYVPDSLVNSYKAHEYWGTLSSKIKPLSEYNGGV